MSSSFFASDSLNKMVMSSKRSGMINFDFVSNELIKMSIEELHSILREKKLMIVEDKDMAVRFILEELKCLNVEELNEMYR